MTSDRDHHLCRLEQVMQEKRRQYEECLLAFSSGALEEEGARKLHLIRQVARAEYLEAKVAFDEAACLMQGNRNR